MSVMLKPVVFTMEQHKRFRELFKFPMGPFIDKLGLGFDIVAFDKWLNVPDGVSTRDHLINKYSEEHMSFIERLLEHSPETIPVIDSSDSSDFELKKITRKISDLTKELVEVLTTSNELYTGFYGKVIVTKVLIYLGTGKLKKFVAVLAEGTIDVTKDISVIFSQRAQDIIGEILMYQNKYKNGQRFI